MEQNIFDNFEAPLEKGSGEWKTFNAVTHDRTSLINASTVSHKPKLRTPTAIRFGASRLFILKHA